MLFNLCHFLRRILEGQRNARYQVTSQLVVDEVSVPHYNRDEASKFRFYRIKRNAYDQIFKLVTVIYTSYYFELSLNQCRRI